MLKRMGSPQTEDSTAKSSHQNHLRSERLTGLPILPGKKRKTMQTGREYKHSLVRCKNQDMSISLMLPSFHVLLNTTALRSEFFDTEIIISKTDSEVKLISPCTNDSSTQVLCMRKQHFKKIWQNTLRGYLTGALAYFHLSENEIMRITGTKQMGFRKEKKTVTCCSTL